MSLTESKTISGSIAGVYDKSRDVLVRSVGYNEDENVFKVSALSCTEDYYFWPSYYIAPDQRNAIFMYGSSGIGKSTFADAYMHKFLEEPKNVCLVIKPDSDGDKFIHKRTKMLTPIELKELVEDDESILTLFRKDDGRCLVIFDDVLSSSDKSIESFMQRVIDLVCERGRKFSIDIIVITHMGSNHKQTRVIQNECNIVWFNPRDLTHNSIYTLERKFGVDRKVIAKIKDSPESFGRWCIISQHYPKFLLSPKKIALISGEHL